MPPPRARGESGFRSLRSLQGVRRSAFHSFYRKGLEAVGVTPDESFPKKLASLLPRNWWPWVWSYVRSEEHTSELQSQSNLVCRLLLEKKKEKEEAHENT